VAGECERVLEAPSSNIRGETNISKDIRDRYGSVATAKRKAQGDSIVKKQLHENKRLRKDHDGLFKRKLTLLFKSSREEYLSTLAKAHYQQQIEESCQIVRLYASLCGRQEYPRTRRGQ
jgi:hypothetical protein